MNPSQKFLQRLGLKDPAPADTDLADNKVEEHENGRRSFLKKSTLGGIALGGAFLASPIEDLIAQSTQKVSRYSG